MSNVKYLKGVRTRYFNILDKEVKSAHELLETDLSLANTDDVLSNIHLCVDKLKTYVDKLEVQSEKLTCAIGETDEELTDSILKDDTNLCDAALEICSKLKLIEAKLYVKVKQEQIDSLNKPQSFTDLKSTPRVPRSTVKLPKLEIINFNGNKCVWLEFWQSFENSIHNNESLCDFYKFNYLRSKLSGEAKRSIEGLSLSNENYRVAVDILKDRFDRKQLIYITTE